MDLLAFALAPAAVLMVLIYKADIGDKEPWGLILTCVGLGAVSTLPVCLIEGIADGIIYGIFGNTMAYLVVSMLIGVALVEEGFKMAAALLPTWRGHNFNYVFDGIVYCVAGAVGFAAVENVMYVCFYVDASEAVGVALTRGLISVPSHIVDGIFMGVLAGYAKLFKYQGKASKCRLFLILAILAPIAEHCVFDTLCSLDSDAASEALLVIVFFEYAIAIGIVFDVRKKKGIPIPGLVNNDVPYTPAVGMGRHETPAALETVVPAMGDPKPLGTACAGAGAWICPGCGAMRTSKFCPECGVARPMK